jgi:hypothetical protein
MLICKGSRVRFILKDDREISPRGALLHDPTGRYWPKDSMLVVSFKRGGRRATDAERKGAPKDYLGRNHEARVGSVELPPRSLSEWQYVGDIKTILYVRPGTKAPGSYYHHFGGRRLAALFKSGKAKLYKRGSTYRVELGSGSIADDRGIVYP